MTSYASINRFFNNTSKNIADLASLTPKSIHNKINGVFSQNHQPTSSSSFFDKIKPGIHCLLIAINAILAIPFQIMNAFMQTSLRLIQILILAVKATVDYIFNTASNDAPKFSK